MFGGKNAKEKSYKLYVLVDICTISNSTKIKILSKSLIFTKWQILTMKIFKAQNLEHLSYHRKTKA